MKKIFIVLIALVLSGCGSVQLNSLGIVQGVAFDVPKEKLFKMSGTILSADDEQYKSFSAEGNTIAEVSSRCSVATDKKLFFGQNRIIALSDEYAKSGIKEMVISFYQSTDKRSSEQLVVCKGNAEAALTVEAITEETPALSIAENIKSAEATTYISSCTLHDFALDSCSEAKTALVPMGYVSKNEQGKTYFELSAMGVFFDYKLIGELTEDEARGAKWLRNNADGDVLIINSDDFSICIQIEDSSIRLAKEEDGYAISADISFSIEEADGKKYTPDVINQIEKATELEVNRLINCAINAGKRMNADFIDLSHRFPGASINSDFSISSNARLKYLGMAVSPVE